MKFTNEMIEVIQKAPYLTLVTVTENGTVHPVIVGGKEQKGDTIHIGIYKLDVTKKNLSFNPKAWIVVATVENGPKGFRFYGTAVIKDKELVFTPDAVETMI